MPIISLPVKMIKLFESNVSPNEIAAGVCLGMFLGFVPLNGPMAVLLVLVFLFFKINRISTVITLPFFKVLYVLGVSGIADKIGGYLLLEAKYLTHFWEWITWLPVIAYLDLNNTLIAGGLALSILLFIPVFLFARTFSDVLKKKYNQRLRTNSFVKWFKKLDIVQKIGTVIDKLRSNA